MNKAVEKYTKKPVTIEAWKFTKEIALDFWNNKTLPPFGCNHISGQYHPKNETVSDAYFYIDTLEGKMKASLGDYIIKGVAGEYYPCKPDIFEATYSTNKPPSLEAIIAKIEAEKYPEPLKVDDDVSITWNEATDKAISIIREFQTNQQKGN